MKYTLSQAASVRFTVMQVLPGRKRGASCQAPSRRNRKGKPCKRLVVIGSFTRPSTAGANAFRFTGRVNGSKLARGNYKLVLVATNAAGKSSTKANRPFRIVR